MNSRKRLFSFLLALLMLLSMSIPAYADASNITGGGGDMGQGTNNNGWAVTGLNGGFLFDGEGLRIYLADRNTGIPITGKPVRDITNYAVATTNVYNGAVQQMKRTKYDYLYGGKTFSGTSPDYQYKLLSAEEKLPQIIPWDESDSTERIEKIRKTFLGKNGLNRWLNLLNVTEDEIRKNGYILMLEPIIYFRYNGNNYALTATECALLDEKVGGDLFCKLNPLTHKNLPLSMFLENDAFKESSTPLYKWTGSKSTRIKDNSQIVKYLGIGFFEYDYEPPESDFPTLDLPITLEAEPDGQEVTGEAGYPANLTENVTLKLSMPLGEAELSKWEEVLLGGETTEKVDEVNVEIKLQSMQYQTANGTERYIGARDNFKFTGGSVPSSAKASLSALNREYTSIKMSGTALYKMLESGYLTWTDSTSGQLTLNAAEAMRFNCQTVLRVSFDVPKGYSKDLVGTKITVKAHEAGDESVTLVEDEADYFRNADPVVPDDEYMSYTSKPKAYAEIKEKNH